MQRNFGDAVRLEVSHGCDEKLAKFLLQQFDLPKQSLYRVNGLVNLARLMQLADLAEGDSFGEEALVSNAPRNATVRSAVDSEVLEINADEFKQFILANPASLNVMGTAVATRQAELDQARAQGPTQSVAEQSQGLVDRIRRFFDVALN